MHWRPRRWLPLPLRDRGGGSSEEFQVLAVADRDRLLAAGNDVLGVHNGVIIEVEVLHDEGRRVLVGLALAHRGRGDGVAARGDIDAHTVAAVGIGRPSG